MAKKVLPILSVLYFILAETFGLTLLILAILLGMMALLALLPEHHDGKIVVGNSPEGKKLFSLELDDDPLTLEKKSSVSFKIVAEDSQEKHSL
jgi:hypothetical protein